MSENDLSQFEGARITVVGVGGGGGNAINNMIGSGLSGVQFIAVNSDVQDLQRSLAPRRFQLGGTLTRGLGAGANPEVGRESALGDRDRLAELLVGSDMVFVTAGMGGGTGTGAAPVVAEIARDAGALTVGVVTTPFDFEGRKRRRNAEEGVTRLFKHVDTLITIPNQKLLGIVGDKTSMKDAFRIVDDVLLQAVQGVSDLVRVQGMVNVDFADVRTIMANKGTAVMGVGRGKGPHRTIDAAQRAIRSPLLDDRTIAGARSVLVNITGGPDLTMYEVNEASTLIEEEAHQDVDLIWGWVVDERMGDEVRVMVIATGFDHPDAQVVSVRNPATRQVPQRRATPPAAGGGPRDGEPRRGTINGAAKNALPKGKEFEGYDLPTFFNNAD